MNTRLGEHSSRIAQCEASIETKILTMDLLHSIKRSLGDDIAITCPKGQEAILFSSERGSVAVMAHTDPLQGQRASKS